MKYTENLNLKKPEKSDYINVEDFNDNADIIDKELKDLDNNKVEKEEGKGLTKNEFTDTDKDKLDGIEERANKTEIVDSLNSNDINKALSAKQGKRLEDKKADKNYVDEQVENIEVPVTSVNDKTGDVNLSKSDIELDNVDNVKQASKEEFDEHLADKANPHSTNKTHVGLSNVDNVKQMPISGGVLENYREKLATVSAANGSINLSLGNVFQHTPSGNRTYSISNAVNGQAHSFTLIINMGSTVRTLTFPASVKWQGGEIPDMSETNKTYVLTFVSVDGGSNWLGMFGGAF